MARALALLLPVVSLLPTLTLACGFTVHM